MVQNVEGKRIFDLNFQASSKRVNFLSSTVLLAISHMWTFFEILLCSTDVRMQIIMTAAADPVFDVLISRFTH